MTGSVAPEPFGSEEFEARVLGPTVEELTVVAVGAHVVLVVDGGTVVLVDVEVDDVEDVDDVELVEVLVEVLVDEVVVTAQAVAATAVVLVDAGVVVLVDEVEELVVDDVLEVVLVLLVDDVELGVVLVEVDVLVVEDVELDEVVDVDDVLVVVAICPAANVMSMKTLGWVKSLSCWPT